LRRRHPLAYQAIKADPGELLDTALKNADNRPPQNGKIDH
jgi:hypothetical protein